MDKLKVENMAKEAAKSGRLLPHQLRAFQFLDSLLTPEERNQLSAIWRQNTGTEVSSNVFLLFVPTDRWDNALRQWELILMNGDRAVDKVICHSGAPGAQEFVDPKRDYPGSMRPIPPGRYIVGPVEVAPSGSWGEGLGRIWIPLTAVSPPNARSGFGIHLDSNRAYAPGSAGCIVTPTEESLQRIVGWLKQQNRPKFLEVVYSPKSSSIPSAAIDLIKRFEGCHLKAYPDPITGGEPWTIGWGSTKTPDGHPIKPGMIISQEEADRYLYSDLERCHTILASSIPNWGNLRETQKAALLSFAYNVGPHFYGHPNFITISKVLRDKEYDKVPKALELYRNPGTAAEAGLLRRRRAEGELWRRT